ncbi:hypothetical protein PILCRDRAFT_222341 [Piloderma croceum F 1598]|uniref:Uncharacterized protein n=1 Tax=Piloderma croceum (strain F 1598) TaxID=765440 RepID=A0A0C3BS67_PILCF|nr:hypothetical protein PILCRDRAFT_222341 [Piloderma croceum F 1598]
MCVLGQGIDRICSCGYYVKDLEVRVRCTGFPGSKQQFWLNWFELEFHYGNSESVCHAENMRQSKDRSTISDAVICHEVSNPFVFSLS